MAPTQHAVFTTTITGGEDIEMTPLPTPAPRRRNHPILALLSIVLLLGASGFGIALFVMSRLLTADIPMTGSFESRLVMLVASCMTFVYVLLHAIGARRGYPRYPGAPHLYGNHVYSTALLLVRLAVPVWVAAVVLTALQAAKRGIDEDRSFFGNVPWWNLTASGVGLLTTLTTLFSIESSLSPFATSILSPMSYISNRPRTGATFDDLADRSVSRAGRLGTATSKVSTRSQVSWPVLFRRTTDTADRFSEGNVWFGFQVDMPAGRRTATPDFARRKSHLAGLAQPARLLTPKVKEKDIEEDTYSLMASSPRRAVWRTTHPFVPGVMIGGGGGDGVGNNGGKRDTVSSLGSEVSESPSTTPSVMSFSEPSSPVEELSLEDAMRQHNYTPVGTSLYPVGMVMPERAVASGAATGAGTGGDAGPGGPGPEDEHDSPADDATLPETLKRSVTNFSRKRALSTATSNFGGG